MVTMMRIFIDENNEEFTDFQKLVDARIKSFIAKDFVHKHVLEKESAEQLQHTVFLLRIQSLWTKRIRRA